MTGVKKILFVCVENAGRSQMAEGFFRKYAPIGYESQSAGTKPIDAINPLAITAMKEIEIDISNQQPKIISDSMIRQSSKIVNMGCMDKESCPAIFVQNVLDWEIPDPKGKSLDEVRKIRNLIEKRMLDFCKTLE
ncbi:MAG: arsenate reductase ArsC [Candidatus Nitrosotenuis sp.]|nr:MAG: arsenate reductase ArsC [Candidatus Nitrosotenuis sp.]